MRNYTARDIQLNQRQLRYKSSSAELISFQAEHSIESTLLTTNSIVFLA